MFFGSFGGWRLKLRQADQAFRDGHLTEAAERIQSSQLQEYLPGRRLAQKVAAAIARRAEQQLAADVWGAWAQWDRANQLCIECQDVLDVQEIMIRQALQAAEEDLSRESPRRALERLEPLRQRQLGGEPRTRLEEVAKRLESAKKLRRLGRFGDAKEQLAFAGNLRPDLAFLSRALQQAEEDYQRCRELDRKLHEVMQGGMWSDALATADALLEMAPEHKVAQVAKRRAWAEVGAASRAPSESVVMAMAHERVHSGEELEIRTDTNKGGDTVAGAEVTDRFLLWVDAVGGYLVCRSPEIVIGQSGGAGVDVPLLADVSRRHAKLRREQDTYLLEPISPVLVEGKVVDSARELHDGDEIELGRVRLRFRHPHPLSCTARLEFVSHHRTQPTADGVLLMAESCVLGPSTQSHVVCREFANDVVLFHRDGRLHCRCMTPVEVDGRRCDGTSALRNDSHVAGDDFSLSLEPC